MAETELTKKSSSRVQLGAEVLLEKPPAVVRGKKVGLITNPTGLDGNLNSLVQRFRESPDFKLEALYGPEHGVRGNAQAGETVPYYIDPQFQLPVFSLYGQSENPPPGMLRNIDAFMRSFDTTNTGKQAEGAMIDDVEVMLFDIQDVGTRIYTYIATMAYAMVACAEREVPFIVLDRPNPINGVDLEGPLLEYPRYSSFVGLYPIPVRHGMTVGELAWLFNDRFLTRKAPLTVVPMKGWQRKQWHDETGLPWVMPSPNMPTLDTATVYPGQVYLEGTNLSEGRGTTRPFELFGAPWIDGPRLADRLNRLDLPGVRFREAWFTPSFSKFQGQPCGGCQMHVIDRAHFRPFQTTLRIFATVREMHPGRLEFHAEYFDQIIGSARVRETLEKNEDITALMESFAGDVIDFAKRRKAYLLYPE